MAPLLPARPPRLKGGRPPLDNRKALDGIVFVLRTGIPWTSPPKRMGCDSGMTCWRRLRDRQAAGVFERLHRALLDRLVRHRWVTEQHGYETPAQVRPEQLGQLPVAASAQNGVP